MILKSTVTERNYLTKVVFLVLLLFVLGSCSKDPIREKQTNPPPPSTDTSYQYGDFVINEGNFTWGNASVTYINPSENAVTQDIFYQANGRDLGDVAAMMKIHDSLAYLVVNNSNTIEVVKLKDFKSVKTISGTGLNKPRAIEFVNDFEKAYVTNLVKDISVIDLKTNSVYKTIQTPNWTEGMVRYGNYIFFACIGGYNLPNSERNPQILVVDILQDRIVDSIKTGKEPLGMVMDRKNKIWILCTGGYDNFEPPSLLRVDPVLQIVEQTFHFQNSTGTPSRLCINGTGDTLYFLDNGVYQMPVTSADIPSAAFIPGDGHSFYGLGIHPTTGNIFVSDAVDYVQNGTVYQYNQNDGSLIRSFEAGKIPGSFCFSVKPSSK
ncbi:MAG TPA: DUF5074 domain-containing protein [Bacteroidales bacterium]|nr:DUF5074 domain-containing protein [Bacteroidales bacterium]